MMPWFRVEARHHADVDDWGDVIGSHSYLQVIEYDVVKETPKGVWLQRPFMAKKFVLREILHRGRAFAAPTEDQAREDFRLRKQFRINRLQSQINQAQREIDLLSTGYVQRITA